MATEKKSKNQKYYFIFAIFVLFINLDFWRDLA